MKRKLFILLFILCIQLQKSFSQNTVKLDTVEGYLYSFEYNLGQSSIGFFSFYNYTSTLIQKLEKWPKGYPTYSFVIEQFVSDSMYYIGERLILPEIKYPKVVNTYDISIPYLPYDAIYITRVKWLMMYSDKKHYEVSPSMKAIFKEIRVVDNTFHEKMEIAVIVPFFQKNGCAHLLNQLLKLI